MQEFDSISVSSYEAEKLTAQLNERSADGWEVVSILSAGSDVVAYLSRPVSATTTSTADATAVTLEAPDEPAAAAAAATVAANDDWGPGGSTEASEPEGWGSAPDSASDGTSATSGWGDEAAVAGTSAADTWGSSSTQEPAAGSGWGTGSSTDDGWGTTGSTAAAAGTASDSGTPQPSTPSVPAGWFTDPSNRYELRYWDGTAWTEHVARGGQQYTDPPVA